MKLQIKPNSIFNWVGGQEFTARARTMVVLPGSILQEGKAISSIIELSNNATPISFQKKDTDRGFKFIIVDLGPGDSMKLNKSTEVIFKSNLHAPLEFEIRDEREIHHNISNFNPSF